MPLDPNTRERRDLFQRGFDDCITIWFPPSVPHNGLRKITAAAALFACLAAPLSAQEEAPSTTRLELKDHSWLMSVGGGLGVPLGGAKKVETRAYAASGEALYVPRGEY